MKRLRFSLIGDDVPDQGICSIQRSCHGQAAHTLGKGAPCPAGSCRGHRPAGFGSIEAGGNTKAESCAKKRNAELGGWSEAAYTPMSEPQKPNPADSGACGQGPWELPCLISLPMISGAFQERSVVNAHLDRQRWPERIPACPPLWFRTGRS